VVARVEWRQRELFPRAGFIVTNLGGSAPKVVNFHNRRDTAEMCQSYCPRLPGESPGWIS